MTSLFSRLLLAAGLVLGVAGPRASRASVPLTANVADGYNFSGFSRQITLDGNGMAPFGGGFDLVASRYLISGSGDFDIVASFPGTDVGETVVVNDGDTIDFEIIAELLLMIEVIDVDPTADFGGGLGDSFSTTAIVPLLGSGQAVANTFLPNLGLLSALNYLSFAVSTASGRLLTTTLPDLNGDGTPELLILDGPAFDSSGTDTPGFEYSEDGTTVTVPVTMVDDPPTTNATGSINPSFDFGLTITEWAIEQDALVPAEVPEPGRLGLVGMGALAALVGVGRRGVSVPPSSSSARNSAGEACRARSGGTSPLP